MEKIKSKLNKQTALYVLQAMAEESTKGTDPVNFEYDFNISNVPIKFQWRVVSAKKDGNNILVDVEVHYTGCRAKVIEENRESVKGALRTQLSEILGLNQDVLKVNPLFLDTKLLLQQKIAEMGGRPNQDQGRAS